MYSADTQAAGSSGGKRLQETIIMQSEFKKKKQWSRDMEEPKGGIRKDILNRGCLQWVLSYE